MTALRSTTPRIWAVFVLLVAALSSQGQTNPPEVEIDLSALAVKSNVPFDELFVLKGTVGAAVQRLEMGYAEGCAPRRVGIFEPTQVWNRTAADQHTFRFTVNPLDPHTCYTFAFDQFLQPASETDRKLLQSELTALFRGAISEAGKQGFLSEANKVQLTSTLQGIANRFVRDKFHAAAPTINLDDPRIVDHKVTLFTHASEKATAEGNLLGLIGSVKQELCIADNGCNPTANAWQDFRAELIALIADPAALAPGAKTLWNAPVNASREPHKAVTVAQVAAILATQSVIDLISVVAGRARIAGSVIQPAAVPDPESLQLIADFLRVTSGISFATVQEVKPAKGKQPVKTNVPVMNQALRDNVLTAIGQIRELATNYARIAEKAAAINSTDFPDILAGHLLQQQFTIPARATIQTENANPYISADVGFGYALRADKGYPYYGVNFYRVPVNKRAPLSQFHGWERFNRSASLLIGLTTSAFEEGRNKNYTSAGSPMLGFGYRIGQSVKLNGGLLAFKQTNPNPVIAKLDEKYVPFFSISIDLDVRTFLKNAGGLFPTQ